VRRVDGQAVNVAACAVAALKALLCSIVARLAEGLQPAKPEAGVIAPVRLDMVGNAGVRHVSAFGA
jgi:hypothetical protein